MDHRKMFNALVTEEARSHIESLDLIKFRDMLKLTLGFKATLPIDHLYALIGLFDERHTPLFHPRFGTSDFNGVNRIMDPRTGVSDIGHTLSRKAQILGAMKGQSKNRRAKAIVAAGSQTALRYIALLSRDLKIAMANFDQIPTSFAELEEERMQSDYTLKSTAQLVYTYAARDLIKQDDAVSFICYAGTAYERHQELGEMQSWVPDWSQDITTCVLPWRTYDEPKPVIDEPENREDSRPAIKVDGSKFLLVQGYRIGTVSHAIGLTQDCNCSQLETREGVLLDFKQLQSKFKAALDVVEAALRMKYPDTESLKQDFYSTLAVSRSIDDQRATSMMRDWTLGLSNACPIAAETFLEMSTDSTSTAPSAHTNDNLRDAVSRYADIRRRSSSIESKLAHLIRVDVIPSFAQYRTVKPIKKSNQMPSILEDANSGPLVAYAQYVDYTTGRSYIITDTSMMGLSPSAAKVGGILIETRSKGRTICLTLREVVEQDSIVTTLTASTNSPEVDNPQLSSKTYRLIGEAYVHQTAVEAPPVHDLQWFRLS